MVFTPQVGFEPTTHRLTAGCSAAELLRNWCQDDFHTLKTEHGDLVADDNPTAVGATCNRQPVGLDSNPTAVGAHIVRPL